MAKDETPKKRPKVPFNGNDRGQGFTSERQPSPEAKKAGWEAKRAERLLTQKIIEKMTNGQKLDDYVEALYNAAVLGNAKAIDTINKGIEDQVEKMEVKHEGTPPIQIDL
jgi:hypothetical protein